MKGIAEITVRDKDGKIKERRTEHNTITTAHLEKLKQAIANQIYDRTTPDTGAFMFQGIWLHSKQLGGLTDMQPVVLCGATTARASGVSQDYSQATKSGVSGNDINNTWVWVLEKDVTINAISLHADSFIERASGWLPPTYPIVMLNDVEGVYFKEDDNACYKISVSNNVTNFYKRATSEGADTPFYTPLYRANEFFYTGSTSATPQMTSVFGVVDNTMSEVRYFKVSQLSGLSDGTTYSCKVMPTAAADWLFVIKSATEVAVYKIPRTASSDTIPLVTTITGTGFSASTTLIVLNCAIFKSTSKSKTMFTAQADGTYAIETGCQILNGAFSTTNFGMHLPITASNPTPTVSLSGASELGSDGTSTSFNINFSGFPHNTILNLAAPIEAETGDTLTITYTVTVEQEEAPTPPSSSSTFSTDSWATIAAASADGTASTKYKIGDEKTITLTTGEAVTVQIWGFNHDDLADGSGKAGITLGMKNLLAATYKMSSSDTNIGGWQASSMRTTTMPAILATLPEDLQAVIKEVSKLSSEGGSNADALDTTTDKLFLFSVKEITGANTYSLDGEGTQYAWWNTLLNNSVFPRNRIKYMSNGGGNAYYWWTRSAASDRSNVFCCFDTSGNVIGNHTAGWSYGVCLGFCV